MPFHDLYRTKGVDAQELFRVCKSHGYDNPGPIIAYPPNQSVFNTRQTPGKLPPGAQVLIPWHPTVLRKLIATSEFLAIEFAKDATRIIESQQGDKEDLERFLIKVDSVCLLINMGKSLTQLITEAKEGMTAAQAVAWFANSRLDLGKDIATLAIPAPDSPKRDFKWVVRHTLGPWTPSFWASVYAAIKEGDSDIYSFGPAAETYKTKLRIKTEADRYIGVLRMRIAEARQQLGMPFYNHRV
jgi:hypothetical protein